MKTRQAIRRVPFNPPAPFGIEVMTLSQLRAMAGAAYLQTPQRPVFHLLMIGTAGATGHTVDFVRYRLTPERMLWVRPGQVQRFGDAADDDRPSADLVLFQSDFLIPETPAAAIADDRLAGVALEHRGVALAGVRRAVRELRREYATARTASHATVRQTETLRHLLSVVVLRLGDERAAASDEPNDLYRRFRELLERDFAIAHDVGHYAHHLRYSSRTLGRSVQAATGQSPKQVIQDRIALEARRLLAHTDLPISTIARQLGFRDPSNFSSFFVDRAAETPTAFRAQQRAADPGGSPRR